VSGPVRLLIIGGYGIFGGRLVTLLEGDDRLTILVAGRSVARASDFIRGKGAVKANVLPLAFDRDGDVAAQVGAAACDILIDASGPFQGYGPERYRVVEACLRHRVHYLDRADGADFVVGVGAYDAAARACGLFILSGVSTCPALTAAAVRGIAGGMRRVTSIRAGIAPSPRAPIGHSVVAALAAYAGQPIALHRRQGYALTEHMRYSIAPPGYLPLVNKLFSLVEVPDLRVLAALWPEAETIWIGAGPAPESLHIVAVACAWGVRWRVLRSLSPLAGLMAWAANRRRWGEHRGGMFVAVEGTLADGETPVRRSWHVVAEGDDGPFIPAIGAAALVRNYLDGQLPAPGARPASTDLELADYERFFAARRIYGGQRDDGETTAPLFARLLGAAWHELPAAIRRMHEDTVVAEGRARVRRGRGLLARLSARLIGFPAAADDTPLRLVFARHARGETWTRRFGSDSFSSEQTAGTARWDRLLCERFGPLRFGIALLVEDETLHLVLRHWRFVGVPLPLWLAPHSTAFEFVEEGRFRFDIAIGHWLTGLIVGYDGWLIPEDGDYAESAGQR
jgi:hypothetical protein